MLNILNDNKNVTLNSIEIKIVEHCNLNCVGCYSYSNIAKKDIYPIVQFESDLKHLNTLFKKIHQVRLLGGEPLLLDNILDYIIIVKKYFSMAEIIIVTNGLLLKDLKESVYERFKDLRVVFSISYYMGRALDDVKAGIELLKNNHIKFYVYPTRYFAAEHDDANKDNITEIFEACKLRIKPAVLYKGKIYACPKPISILHYDKKYNTQYYCEEDGIDIHNFNITGVDILAWLEKPMKTCRTCSVRPAYIRWQQGPASEHDWFNDYRNQKLINEFHWYEYLIEMNYLKYNILEIKQNKIISQESINESKIQYYYNKDTHLWISCSQCMYLYNELFMRTLLKYSLNLNYVFKTDSFIELHFKENQVCLPTQIPSECKIIMLVKDKQDYLRQVKKIKSNLINE
jgi:organic radical activating enzyme